MYRLKSRKMDDDDWIPIITNPDIIREYAQCEVSTLHQKNLLLLGEDRFLSTLMLRTFPNRKMLFCPQARCRTIAPDTFSVLLSQRRRWISAFASSFCARLPSPWSTPADLAPPSPCQTRRSTT